MDEPRLPVLKNFEADTAPPETPDPWWKRCCVYALLMVALPVLFAGGIYCLDISDYSKHYRDYTLEQINQNLKWDMIESTIVGLLCAIGLSVYFEIRTLVDKQAK